MKLFVKIALIIFIVNSDYFIGYAQTPVIQPKANITLHLDATGNLHILPTDVADITTTAATPPISNVTPDTFSCSSLGQQMLMVTADDGAGHMATPVQVTVTVVANPSIVTAKPGPIMLILDATGHYTVKPEDVTTVTGCGPAPSIQLSPAGFDCSTLGPRLVTVTTATINPAAVSFNSPNGLTFDKQGNLYVADAGNSAIRKIAPDGTTTTLVSGLTNINGITTDNQNNIYVADGNQLKMVTPTGEVNIIAGSTTPGDVDGTGVNARFDRLYMGSVDASGNIYVADYWNRKVKKVSPAGVVTTVGTGLYGAISLTIDGMGNIFATTFGSSLVMKVATDGTVSTFAGTIAGYEDGPGTIAQFLSPIGLIIDASGNLYITDTGNNRVRKIAPDGTVSTFAGSSAIGHTDGPALSATFNHPQGMAIDAAGNLYVIDQSLIRKIAPDGTVSTFAGVDQQGFINGKIDETTASVATTYAVPVTVVNSVPAPSVSVVPSETNICKGTPVTFTTTVTDAGNSPIYQWKVNGIDEGLNSSQFTSNTLNNGDMITCTVTSSTGCALIITSAPVNIRVTVPPIISLTNVTIQKGSSIQLHPLLTGDITNYTWSPAIGLSNTIIANPIANPENTTIYTLTVTSAGDCTDTKQVTVNVVTTIVIPNTFTPNNDGINDLWEIPALAAYPGCTVDIYNRYGEKVYHSIDYTRAWDGNSKSRPLPAGTYYYVINPKNKAKLLSGYVTILR